MGSNIEWTDETWNPITGCTPISAGCKNCYAKLMAQRLAGRYGYPKDDPFRVTWHPDQLDKPLHWHKPRRIFVESMGDLFHWDVPGVWIKRVLEVTDAAPQHTYLLLTKRPKEMDAYFQGYGFPGHAENLWLGVTAENQARLDERVPILLQIPAVHWVSLEPLLGPIALAEWPHKYLERPRLDWVVVGCETGPGRRPCRLKWIADVVRQCKDAGVPCFVKKIPLPDDKPEGVTSLAFGDSVKGLDNRIKIYGSRVSKDMAEWPQELRVREWPK